MKPTHDDLCAAVIALGVEPCAIPGVAPTTFKRLIELELATPIDDGFELIKAGDRLLHKLMNELDVAEFS